MLPLLFFSLLCSPVLSADYLDDGVSTPSGPIIGRSSRFFGQIARAYLGIPYAQPPVDEQRFQKPKPAEPWNGTLLAQTMPPACVQNSEFRLPWDDNLPDQSEDCLYLNVWSGRFSPELLKVPVMVWLHGGDDFATGSNRLEPSIATSLAVLGRVMVVQPNYRLGPMGFLATDSEDAPGNVGLHDVILALKWVQENIAPFGGDPTSVTVFGQGSGAALVNLLLTSPAASGLFHKAIMQSGSFVTEKGFDEKKHNQLLFERLAKHMECAEENSTIKEQSEEIVKCLREKDARKLVEAMSSLEEPNAFLPQYGDDILPVKPSSSFKQSDFVNNVPLMMGVNKDEGSVLLTTRYPEVFGVNGIKDTEINKEYGSAVLRREFSHLQQSDDIIEQYLGNIDDDDFYAIRREVYTAMGDYNVTCPLVYLGESYARANNSVHFYIYNFRPSWSPWAQWLGVTHYDEVAVVFGRAIEGYDYNTFMDNFNPELGMNYKMLEIWSRFAYVGKGLREWKNFSTRHHQYMLLEYNAEKRMRGPGPHLDNCNVLRQYFDV